MDLARRLAAGPPIAYRYMKENFNRVAQGADVIECLDLEATHHVHSGLSDDHKNAARAFVEKTQPVFEAGRTECELPIIISKLQQHRSII